MTTRLPKVRLLGRPGSPSAYEIRDFLSRSVVQFDWLELASDDEARREAGVESLDDARLPICEFPDGERLEAPTVRQVAGKLGWISQPKLREYDVSIYGAGPSGLSAAVYAASEGLRTVLIEREAVGGQAGTSSMIENYLGIPGRHFRGRACRAGTAAGGPFRGRDSPDAGGHQGGIPGREDRRQPGRWRDDGRPHQHLCDRRRISPAGPARRGTVPEPWHLLRCRGQRGEFLPGRARLRRRRREFGRSGGGAFRRVCEPGHRRHPGRAARGDPFPIPGGSHRGHAEHRGAPVFGSR